LTDEADFDELCAMQNNTQECILRQYREAASTYTQSQGDLATYEGLCDALYDVQEHINSEEMKE